MSSTNDQRNENGLLSSVRELTHIACRARSRTPPPWVPQSWSPTHLCVIQDKEHEPAMISTGYIRGFHVHICGKLDVLLMNNLHIYGM
jgi:hypothetical protein